MSKINAISLYGIITRALIGSSFFVSGINKALASREILIEIYTGLGLTNFLSSAMVYILPVVEINLGLFLVFGLFNKQCSLVLTSGLAIYEILLLQAWLRNVAIAAVPLFGIFMNEALSREIFENVLLILLLYPAALYGLDFTLDKILLSRKGKAICK